MSGVYGYHDNCLGGLRRCEEAYVGEPSVARENVDNIEYKEYATLTSKGRQLLIRDVESHVLYVARETHK